MNKLIKILSNTAILCALLLAFSAQATQWTTYEYKNSDGETRWGISNKEHDKIPLNAKTEKKARKTADKMTKNSVMDNPDGEADYITGKLPK